MEHRLTTGLFANAERSYHPRHLPVGDSWGKSDAVVMPKEAIMREKFSIVSVAIAAAIISVSVTRTPAQAPVTPAAAPVLKTPWGEPDLQGIWTSDSDTPLQRP